MTRYVNKRMILAINRMCWRLAGGLDPCGSDNLLEGRTLGFVEGIHQNEMFGQTLYPTLYHQAAAYMYYITKGHLFHDGNKRTGLAVALTFLGWNGIRLPTLPEEDSYRFVINMASGQESASEAIEKTAEWLKGMAKNDLPHDS